MPPSAMTGTLCAAAARGAFADRGDHRHADAGDDARRADRAGADADLDRVDAGVDQRFGRRGGGDVAGDQIGVRERAADPRDHVDHALRMAVRGVDDQHVDAGGDERRARVPSRPCATPIAAPQRRRPSASLHAFGYLIAFWMSLTVISPLSRKSRVDDQQLLDLVLVQDLARLVERRADRHGEQRSLGHDVGRSAG